MKKLKRMQINSDKLMKDEDLMTLRGGQEVLCAVYFDGNYQGVYPFLCYDGQSECDALCASAWSHKTDPWCFCNYDY